MSRRGPGGDVVELAIDTSTDIASIALSQRGIACAELTWPAGRNHGAELVPAIVYLLDKAQAMPRHIEACFVAVGPGSFNGLRAAVGTAKGLAFALGIPLVGIGTLEVEAFPYAESGLPICPVQEAGRGEVASALFQRKDGEWRQLAEAHITTVEALCAATERRTLFCGRFCPGIAQHIEGALGERALVRNTSLKRAGPLAHLGWQRLERGQGDHPHTVQPLYLRRPAITWKTGQESAR